jgi:hypothetical protein
MEMEEIADLGTGLTCRALSDDCLQPDTESSLSTQPNRKRKFHGGHVPGPRNLNDVMDWLGRYLISMVEVDRGQLLNLMTNLQQRVLAGIVLTSTYSGTGAFETVGCMIWNKVVEWSRQLAGEAGMNVDNVAALVPPPFICWAATDLMPASQRCLAAHRSGSRPRHIFTNVLGRLPDAERAQCLAIQSRKLRAFKDCELGVEQGCLTKAELERKQHVLGTELIEELKDVLGSVEFKSTDWCIQCQRQCPISPRHDPALKDLFWMEMAGTTCCPFSTMGPCGRWLSEATLPCLVWAFSTRYYEPDQVGHECVAGFDETELRDILSQHATESMPLLKCPMSRPDCACAGYGMFSTVFSSSHTGVPSDRIRKYSLFNLLATESFVACPQRLLDLFQQIFFRDCVADASIYMQVPESFTKDHLERKAQKYNVDWMVEYCSGSASSGEDGADIGKFSDDLMQSSFKVRRVAYRLKAALQPGFNEMPVAIVNLVQTAGYMQGRLQTRAPALLRGSCLYDLVSDKEVLPIQHWLIQGFPVPGFVDEELSANFPFPSLLPGHKDPLHDKEVRTLTGNSMHVAAVGAWVLFAWSASVHKAKPDTQSNLGALARMRLSAN